ncbi:MAG: lipoprotein [Pseudomonadota bacterium]
MKTCSLPIALMLGATIAVTACGKKGDPIPPSQAEAERKTEDSGG